MLLARFDARFNNYLLRDGADRKDAARAIVPVYAQQ
jgi:hypothetical protein